MSNHMHGSRRAILKASVALIAIGAGSGLIAACSNEALVIHSGEVVRGTAAPGAVTAKVDTAARAATTRHHSATHLLHSALHKLLGDHVEQQGSKVSPTELRFDFNNPGAPTREQIVAVEQWVSSQIAAKHAVDIRVMGIEDAKKLGAKAQFGEKYGAEVRVVSVGDGSVSREFCGGCHVANTADIVAFRITAEGASSAGIRRITAVAGEVAQELADKELSMAATIASITGIDSDLMVGLTAPSELRLALEDSARLLKCPVDQLPDRMQKLLDDVQRMRLNTKDSGSPGIPRSLVSYLSFLQDEMKRLQKLTEQKAAQAAAGMVDELLAAALDLGPAKLIAATPEGLDGKVLRTLADQLAARDPALAVVLASASGGKVGLVVICGKQAQAAGLAAGALIGPLAALVGGKGGGKADCAQAGGTDPAGLPVLVTQAQDLARKSLSKAASGA